MNRPVPTEAQLQATDPSRSNWVTANAGSGKTHVLTQRVARLLLEDVPPHKILCLTYTKAAANEMQTRLFRLLGGWAMASEADLARELANLSGQASPVLHPDEIKRARRLFARALETPGGLKIQTIHAFCDSLLRRFPLEAGISPRFDVADDRQSQQILADVRAEMGLAAEEGSDPGLDLVAALLNEDGIDQLANAVLGKRRELTGSELEDRLLAHFGDAARLAEAEIARRALRLLDWHGYEMLATALMQHGGKSDRPVGEVLTDFWDRLDIVPSEAVQALIGKVLTVKFLPRAPRGFPVKAVKSHYTGAEEDLRQLTRWAEATRAEILASRMAERTRILHRFAGSLLGRHDGGKSALALLDFNDLIVRVRGMLVERSMRSWVLYKLDQGIDHILVDEAQDTSPLQWEVIRAISDEFLSGEGASTVGRSIFVVGDEKQSIYSFQGAEPQAFGDMRSSFAQRLEDLGDRLWRPALTTSFRSAPAILEFVDRVFEGEAAHGLTVDREPVAHEAHRTDARGRVDLWPLIEPSEKAEEPEWWQPVDMVPETDAKEELARVLARQIHGMIGVETLPGRGERPARRVTAGDILVLVTKRDRLARGIIRELKALDVPVAGADRLALTSELAVKDLLALARIAVMPEDDLSTAALLRSPLFGLSEDDLFGLAHGRKGSLRQALRKSEPHKEMAAALDRMTDKADFLRPYEFFEHVLIEQDGRRKLIARLGPEAEDAIDEFLNQALAYEAEQVPMLTGFIAWLDAANITVKREMESGSDEVRVMTVHGAKGLEAPIVILPDTMSATGGGNRPKLVPAVTQGNRPDLTIWLASKDQDDPVTGAAREAASGREQNERQRLLYVALTRAEDWLILCGASARKNVSDTWYEALSKGMESLAETQNLASPTGEGEMRRYQTGPDPVGVTENPHDLPDTGTVLPDWLGPAATEVRAERQRPSDLTPLQALNEGDGTDNEHHGGIGLGRDLAKRRGIAVHLLLEHVSPSSLNVDPDLQDRLLDSALPGQPAELLEGVRAEVEAVLNMPDAQELFGLDALTEVALAIDKPVASADRMIGRIDRLVLTDTHALVVDIKSDATPPTTPGGIPKKYLAQIGAYLSAVRLAWPERSARAAILWTRTPTLMQINAELADQAYVSSRWDLRQN